MKLVQYPDIHAAIRDAFLANFNDIDDGYTPDGILWLEVRERERIKREMVIPNLLTNEQVIVDEGINDNNVVEKFELHAESVMQDLEHQFIKWMKAELR